MAKARSSAVKFRGGGLDSLHQRLIDGDPTVLEQIAARALPGIVRALRRHPGDAAARIDAAEDAILEYAKRPTGFNPSRGLPLERYLLMIARRNLSDRLRRATRRRGHQADIIRHLAIEQRRRPANLEAGRGAALRWIIALASDAKERAALHLWVRGAPAEAIAAALGVKARLPAEATRAVKQLRDRIVKRGRRRLADPHRNG